VANPVKERIPGAGRNTDVAFEPSRLEVNMSGIPLHPLIVHFPVVLAVLLPISAVVALVFVRRGATPRKAWSVPVVVAASLALSAWVATQTGESQEDLVERVVSKRAIHSHEEAAERFLVLTGVLAVVAVVGLARGNVGRAARLVSVVGAFGVLGAGVQVGHSGGLLVYREGAASAYTGTDVTSRQPITRPDGDRDDEDRR
jgi:uncharacterized membrane protein